MQPHTLERLHQRLAVLLHFALEIHGRGVFIRDTQTAACVDVPDVQSLSSQLPHEGDYALHCLLKRVRSGDLRAYVNADAPWHEVVLLRTVAIKLESVAPGNSELMFVQPG